LGKIRDTATSEGHLRKRLAFFVGGSVHEDTERKRGCPLRGRFQEKGLWKGYAGATANTITYRRGRYG